VTLSAIRPAPELLARVPDAALDALCDFYRDRGFRNGGPGETVAELAAFGGLIDAPAVCTRLAAQLIACLEPLNDVVHPEGEPVRRLHERLSGYLPGPASVVRDRGTAVLATVLGILPVVSALQGGGPGAQDPDWIAASVAALHVCLDYVTGCFQIDGLTPADVLAEAARGAATSLPPR
jgi:hypothetical protein